MRRYLWGEFDEDDEEERPKDKMIPTILKKAKLDEIAKLTVEPEVKNVILKMPNPLVTQTIEVMKQTEMLTSLIDTYSTKSGTSNCLLNPCQMIPEVDFPPENSANFVDDEKFSKPIWFIPPTKTAFTEGKPKNFPELTPTICRAALRKSVCGLLSMAGYTDTAESALILLTDATEHFIQQFLQQIRDVHDNDPSLELKNEISVKTLEKACYNHTNSSLLSLHDYYKHSIIEKNRKEIAEFNKVFQDYDKLMKESQNADKQDFQNEGDFMNVMDMPSTSAAAAAANMNIAEINSQTLNLQPGNIVNLMDPHMTGTLKIDVEQDQILADQLSQYANEAFLSN